jgi:hypothetical protein
MNARVSTQQKSDLRRAAVRARSAPSVHNTQPWRFHLSPGELSIYADRSRQLMALDPTARSLTISCGCALMNARVSLAASGANVQVQRFPDPGAPDLLARLISGEVGDDSIEALAGLDQVLELRQTNRREFVDNDVPEDLIGTLEDAAAREGSSLFVIRTDEQRLTVATVCRHADAIEHLSPAYRAELRAWTTDDSTPLDGGPGGNQCLVLLCTNGDGPGDWLRAGEALERVLLEITRHGYVASPFTQVTQVPAARAHLRQELRLVGYPHVLLRVGRAPLTPGSRRRRLVDVLIED